MATTFSKLANNASTKLTSAHTSGSSTLVVNSVSGFPSAPFRVTVGTTIFPVASVSGTTLTIGSPIEGTSDANYAIGTNVNVYFTAGHLQDAYTAINTLENKAVSWVSLSSLGIPSDATLTGVGSSTFTNSAYGTLTLTTGPYAGQTVTAAIQAVLNLAANGPLGIYWDVKCSVGVQATAGNNLLSALYFKRPGNLIIKAMPGCGVILRPGCNSSIFANELPTFGTTISNSGTQQAVNQIGNIQFGNLLIDGLYMNANSGVLTSLTGSPNQASPTFSQTYYLNVIRLFGAQDIMFKNCSFVGAAGFHTYFGNWKNVLIEGCTIDSLGNGGNQGGNDCVHINGPGDNLTIRDCLLACEDDYVAVNTSDGTNSDGSLSGPSVPFWGAITRVRGYNLRSIRSSFLAEFVRIMANGPIFNGGHEFDGLYGQVHTIARIGDAGSVGSTPGTIGNIDFRNLDLDFTEGIILSTTIKRVNLKGIRRSGSNLTVPLAIVWSGPITHLDVEDVLVIDDGTSGSSKPQIEVQSGTISTFYASKIRLDGNTAIQTMPILQVDSGSTVNFAGIHSAYSSNVSAIVSNSGTITTLLVSGTTMDSGYIISNPGTCTNLVISNTDPNTLDYTGNAPTNRSGDYYKDANTYTITGPTTGASNVASTNFTVRVNGYYSGTITITPSGAGLSTPIVLTFSNSLAPQTFTITPTTNGSVTLTPTNNGGLSNPSALTYTSTNTITTYMDDTFSGTTNSSIIGSTPNIVANGSDVWANLSDYGFNGFGVLKFVSGGGCKADTFGTAGAALVSYALTGLPQDQILYAKFTFANGSAIVGHVQMLRASNGDDYIAMSIDITGQKIVISQSISGTTTYSATPSFSFAASTLYTLKVVISGTSLSLYVDTTQLINNATISNTLGRNILIGQSLGTPGDFLFSEIKVTSS